MKPFFNLCPQCGAHLDPGERCDCENEDAAGEADDGKEEKAS